MSMSSQKKLQPVRINRSPVIGLQKLQICTFLQFWAQGNSQNTGCMTGELVGPGRVNFGLQLDGKIGVGYLETRSPNGLLLGHLSKIYDML